MGIRSIKYIFLMVSLFLFNACSDPAQKSLKISTTTWIGYTPLFYAKEKGWLDQIDVKLLHVVSLSENMYLYKAGNADAYVGTQYEHSVLKPSTPTLMPIILFDRSNGGDIIMSNTTIEGLQNSKGTIDTYLEMDSINYTLLKDFIKRYKIDEKRIRYLDRDQTEIAELKNTNINEDVLIVTYIPYNIALKKSGFKEILTTKESLDILVVDALFTKQEVFEAHKDQFIKLRYFIDQAIVALKKDPEEFYTVVKPYMNEYSYEEYLESLEGVEWINSNLTQELSERMREGNFPTKDLL